MDIFLLFQIQVDDKMLSKTACFSTVPEHSKT